MTTATAGRENPKRRNFFLLRAESEAAAATAVPNRNYDSDDSNSRKGKTGKTKKKKRSSSSDSNDRSSHRGGKDKKTISISRNVRVALRTKKCDQIFWLVVPEGYIQYTYSFRHEIRLPDELVSNVWKNNINKYGLMKKQSSPTSHPNIWDDENYGPPTSYMEYRTTESPSPQTKADTVSLPRANFFFFFLRLHISRQKRTSRWRRPGWLPFRSAHRSLKDETNNSVKSRSVKRQKIKISMKERKLRAYRIINYICGFNFIVFVQKYRQHYYYTSI